MRYRPMATITARRGSIAVHLARTVGLVLLSFSASTCRLDKATRPTPPPTNLAILTDPTTATAGVSIAPAVSVLALDAAGKMTPGYKGNVTVAISTNPAGGTLSGTTTVSAVDGVATFTNLKINRAGVGYQLQATASGLTPVTTAPFDITPGAAAQLVFSVEPSPATAGAFLAPQVTAQDALGNTATAFTGAVTMAITAGTGTGGATLSGTATVAAIAGVASFSGLSIDKAGAGYSLSATATNLTRATSASFNIVGGAAWAIAISGGDGQTATVGTALATAPSVFVGDQFNNPVAGEVVTFAVTSGDGSVTGATQTTNAAGIATLGSWTLGTTAGPNTMTAASGTLAGSPLSFTATGTAGTATSIAIHAGHGQTAMVGTAVAGPPAVIVRDQFNNPVPGVAVTFTVASGGGSVSPATPVMTDANGVAAVTGWTLGNSAGLNTLTATADGLSTVSFSATGTASIASSIAISAGNGQTATVGTAVAAPPAVIVLDQFNNPVAGVAVTFAVASGGGSVTGATQTTNAAGVAAVGSWTLGTTAGLNSLTATAGTLAGSPLSFTATGTAGTASSIAISAGDGQSATVGAALGTAPAVIVRDQFNNPVAGVLVTFAVATGGGSVTAAAQTTNAAGIAAVGSWTLGTAAGPNTLVASAGSLTPVSFAATGTTGNASSIAINAGDGQTAAVGTTVAIAPAVIVRDQFGNPVAGVVVTFAVTAGGGSVSPATPVISDANGIAAATAWTLGNSAGINTLTATAGGLAGSPVTFNATGSADAANSMALDAGDGQTAPVGTAVATSPTVIVRDQFNNPVAGVAVTFAVASGGGSITGATQNTNAAGVAAPGSWTLGTTAGPNSLTATAGTLAGSPVSFTATGTTGTATSIAINAGDGQSTAVGTAVATPPAVLVVDQFNNPVAGVVVTFAVASGSGSITGATQTTNAAGVAAVGSWTLGTTAGPNSLTATAATLAGSPLSFTATATTGNASSIAIDAGDGQSATVGAAVTAPPAVIVRDQFNNPVAGVAVTFAVASGGGSVTGATQTTNAAGVAAVGSWTLGTTPGPNSLVANSGGLSPVSFTATATTGIASSIAINAGDGQTATVGTAVATAPTVMVRDQFNNPVAGVAVTFAVTAGAGTLDPATPVTTDASGIAALTSWTLGTTAGSNTLTASAGGLAGSPVSFSATGTAAAATQLALEAGDGQSATVGTAVSIAPAVIVRDQFNNPVAGVAVTFAVASGGGTVDPATPVTTGANGVAMLTSWTLGSTAGANTLTATSSGLTGSPATFSATGTASAATQVALQAGDGQTATVGTAASIAPSVIVRDQFNNPVAGVAVTFAVTTGGGVVDPATPVTTDADGIASATSWTLGSTVGSNTLAASASGLAGSPVSFSATGTAAAATQVALQAGDGQSATVGTAVAPSPAVIVRDQFNNPVAGVEVTFAVTTGGGTVDPTTPVITDASGIATATSWTLGNTAGANSLTATSAGLTGSPVTFTGTSTSGAATQVALQAGDGQSATVGTAIATAPAVLVRD